LVAYATFDDLVDSYEGTIPDTDRTRLETLLRRASKRLDTIVPSTAYRLARGTLDPELPAGLVVDAVLRVYRNPEGVTRDQMGPFSKEFNPRAVKAEISFDHDEVHEILDPVVSVPSSFRLGRPTAAQVEATLQAFSDASIADLSGNLPLL
jgi:hypothetical protein